MKYNQGKAAFNLKEAAKYLGICEPVMRTLINSKEIPAKKIKRRWVISKATLDQWLGEIEVLKNGR